MLTILITGSSRPHLWPYFWESFKKMCIIRQPYRVIVHEDSVSNYHDRSAKVIRYVNHLKSKGEIQQIDQTTPAKGLGWVLNHYIKKILNTKYVFYMQEDWEFERPIDIDQITHTMDAHNNMNLVFFNKIRNSGVINKAEQREYTYDGMKVCLYHGWAFLPGIWRLPFVRKHWTSTSFKPEGHFTNSFGTHDQRMSVDYCHKNMGAYIYGPQADARYIRHLGNDWRMAQWRLEGSGRGHPGGRHDVAMDVPYMAPWLKKNFYYKRPVQADEGYDTTVVDGILAGKDYKYPFTNI
jgi:hypothetical protein